MDHCGQPDGELPGRQQSSVRRSYPVKYQGSETQQGITEKVEVQATNTLSATYTSMAGYAALGDSYSSGEGNPPFTGGACDRSEQAYPVLFQKRLPYTFYFEACSGATVSQLPEQADLVPEAARGTVKLVTLTIGGNDLHFADVIEQCVFDHVLKHTSCSNGVTASDPKVAAWVFDGRLTLQRQLPGVLRILRGTFPQAQIFVLGYPQNLPECLLRRRSELRLRASPGPERTDPRGTICGKGRPLALHGNPVPELDPEAPDHANATWQDQ